MNNIKVKFVLDISKKLAAAPDSDAKVDLVDELSDNLCGRYSDMVAGGMSEADAYAAALDKLGDVNELLDYLDACGENPPDNQPRSTTSDTSTGTAGGDDWFNSLNGFIRQTVDQARNAANDAAAMVRDAVKYADRVSHSARVPLHTDDDDTMIFPSNGLTDIKVEIGGDLTINLDGDADAPVRLDGDIEDLIVRTEGGTLIITREESASGNFLFSRGLSYASIELTIPQRHWPVIAVMTISGDVDIRDGCLDVENLSVKTTSGDVTVDSLEHTKNMVVSTASGDCSLSDSACESLVFHSASGDLDGSNITAGTAVAQTASGDVDLSGDIRDFKAISASGDLSFAAESLPAAVSMTSKSGDCSLAVPDCGGFVFQFSTVSGELHSEFPLTTDADTRQSRGRRCGTAYYQDGGDGRKFCVFSTSGDVELRMG